MGNTVRKEQTFETRFSTKKTDQQKPSLIIHFEFSDRFRSNQVLLTESLLLFIFSSFENDKKRYLALSFLKPYLHQANFLDLLKTFSTQKYRLKALEEIKDYLEPDKEFLNLFEKEFQSRVMKFFPIFEGNSKCPVCLDQVGRIKCQNCEQIFACMKCSRRLHSCPFCRSRSYSLEINEFHLILHQPS